MNLKLYILLVFCTTLFADDPYFQNNKWDIKSLKKVYLKDSSLWPKAFVDSSIKHKELKAVSENRNKKINNPLVKLGEKLFFDKKLSKNNNISCASCHLPKQAFVDKKRVSIGHNSLKGNRNAPTLYGLKELNHLFWDGRASSLEEQALGPILNPVEMALTKDELIQKLKTFNHYEKELKTLFNTKTLTVNILAKALAQYQRTLEPPRTRFDKFLDGNKEALNEKEVLGLHLFRTKARCINCHNGKYLTDGKFHNLGLTYYGRFYEDLGRYNVTLKNSDVGSFKTPTLRQISNTAPYMHNGLFSSLDGIINIYNAGSFQSKYNVFNHLSPITSSHLKKLNLTTEEKEALKAFLLSL